MKKVRIAIFYENDVKNRTFSKPAQIIHVEPGARAIQVLRDKKRKKGKP